MIDLAKGTETASLPLPSNVASSPAYDGKRIYVSTYNGHMCCADPAGPKMVWDIEAKGDPIFYASPAVAKGRVIFAGRDGIVRCLATEDGKELWRFRAG